MSHLTLIQLSSILLPFFLCISILMQLFNLFASFHLLRFAPDSVFWTSFFISLGNSFN